MRQHPYGSLVTSILGLALGSACTERTFQVQAQNTTLDGGSGGTGGGGIGGEPDAGDSPDALPDLLLPPDRPPTTGPCVPAGMEICNDLDDDCNGMVDDVDPALLQSDTNQCGSCNVVCGTPANALPKCAAGNCTYDCAPGAVDIDKGAANGCECLITNGGTEICDGRDNDCNGKIDETFDLQTSDDHCGACGRRCAIPFAESQCVDGRCALDHCRENFYDRDGNQANGCEVSCLKTNGGVEACDDVDNDCDGMVDEGVIPPPSFQCRAMGVCVGSQPTCRALGNGIKGWACDYGPDFEEPETMARGCDGKDNDCDGRTDELFGVGTACTVGVGACASTGGLVCDPADRSKTICGATAKPPLPELCNGVDDDCDGKIDELASASDRTTDDALVYVTGPNVTVFAHEASRYDASGGSAGMDSSQRPCSVPGRLPWANVTKEEARDACARIGGGWRLCTKDEWFAVCSKAGSNDYPYGDTYQATTCNGYDYTNRTTSPPVTTIAAGSANQCRADQTSAASDEVFDMSGNVREWVFTNQSAGTYELRGGAYNVLSFGGDAPGLRCDGSIPAPTAAVRLPSVGFRCCRTGRL